jgi:hypothetical protein
MADEEYKSLEDFDQKITYPLIHELQKLVPPDPMRELVRMIKLTFYLSVMNFTILVLMAWHSGPYGHWLDR